VKVNLE